MANLTILDANKVELVNTYSNGKYTSVKQDGMFYLTTVNNDRFLRVLCSANPQREFEIFDRDLCICFLAEDENEKRNLENTPNHKIMESLIIKLRPDLEKLYAFDSTEISGNFKRILDGFNEQTRAKVFEALTVMGVYRDGKLIAPYKEMESVPQMKWSSKKLYPFAKLNKQSQHFDICSRTPDGGYIIAGKNGGTGSFKAMDENREHAIMVIFDKPVQQEAAPQDLQNDYRNEILEDLKGTSYAAANKFVKIEERITKGFDRLVEEVNKKQGFIDNNSMKYPEIDEEVNQIASLVRKAQNAKDKITKDNYIDNLTGLYRFAYTKLAESEKALKELYANHGIQ